MLARFKQNMGMLYKGHTDLRTINLTKNSSFFVKASDVERLIRQGYLQVI